MKLADHRLRPVLEIPLHLIRRESHDRPLPSNTSAPAMGSATEEAEQHLLLNVDGVTDDGVHHLHLPPPVKVHVCNLNREVDNAGNGAGERSAILRNVNLEIPTGLIVGIIGPSGSGKSTLLRALNRLWEPASGSVFLDGVDICGLDVLCLRRRVGMLFQHPTLFEGTVADNVRYGPSLRGKHLSDGEVQKLLSLADVDASLAGRPASELSVGQSQRVALARTLANEPEVLLLDEPTSALDPISAQNIEEALVHLKKNKGITVVIVSHSIKQIQRVADVVCLLVDGEVVEVLDPARLSEAEHSMARRFLELS